MEHSPYDGATLLNYALFLVDFDFSSGDYSPVASAEHKHLDYKTDDTVEKAIRDAHTSLNAFTDMTDSIVLEFDQYGKKGIVGKKCWNFQDSGHFP